MSKNWIRAIYSDGTKIETDSWKGIYQKDFHCTSGPALFINYNKDQNGNVDDDRVLWSEYYYIEGHSIYEQDFERVFNCSKREDLLEHLLDNDPAVRIFAEYKLKELESGK